MMVLPSKQQMRMIDFQRQKWNEDFMKDTWYGDNRDIVKWGTLAHLAARESIKTIVQIPYLRPGDRPPLQTGSGELHPLI